MNTNFVLIGRPNIELWNTLMINTPSDNIMNDLYNRTCSQHISKIKERFGVKVSFSTIGKPSYDSHKIVCMNAPDLNREWYFDAHNTLGIIDDLLYCVDENLTSYLNEDYRIYRAYDTELLKSLHDITNYRENEDIIILNDVINNYWEANENSLVIVNPDNDVIECVGNMYLIDFNDYGVIKNNINNNDDDPGVFIDIENNCLIVMYWYEPSRWDDSANDILNEATISLKFIDKTKKNLQLIDEMITNKELSYCDYRKFGELHKKEFIKHIKLKIKGCDITDVAE